MWASNLSPHAERETGVFGLTTSLGTWGIVKYFCYTAPHCIFPPTTNKWRFELQSIISNFYSLRSAAWSWSGVREKYCYLAGGWRLELERCESRKL